MTTEVRHGDAIFDANTISPPYYCHVVGYYTGTPNLTAAGVTRFQFQSDRPEKQMAELLGMRTAFLEWFKEMYQQLGRTEREAIGQVSFIVDRWLNPPCGSGG